MVFSDTVTAIGPRRARWARRTGAAAISAALLGAAPAATAGAVVGQASENRSASAAAARATVTLGDLECIRSEDRAGEGDELYIRINGRKVWSSADSVGDGDTIAVNRKAKEGDTVALYDDDWPDGDDFLGSDIVEGGRGTLVFGNDDAEYYLHYD
jgi:endonuclease YncB( thermonuclease family)